MMYLLVGSFTAIAGDYYSEAKAAEDSPQVVLLTELSEAGSATITPTDNKIGDTVTLKATLAAVPTYGCQNMMTYFAGWRDETGTILSTDLTYTFEVTGPKEITAVFKNRSSLKAAGYYRVRSIFNRVLTIEGSYKYGSVSFTGNNVLDGLVTWSTPADLDKSKFANKTYSEVDNDPGVDVESMPSTVIYLEGTAKNLDAGPNQDAVTSANALGQGTDIKTMTGKTFTIKPAIGTLCGYHILYGNILGGGFKMSATHHALLGRCSYDDPYSWMALQPIDEEHFDDFWFGAAASEDMLFEGGYWTSMYTSFPYECRDGVEAYYVRETADVASEIYAQLTKIESGQVPAYSPVLLKCTGLTSRQNRLMPLDYHLELPALEGNMLVGEFQLYTDKDLNGQKDFNPESMRVLGVNADGTVGFYNLAQNADGTYPKLLPNKAYLDISNLPRKTAAIRLDTSGSVTGIENVCPDTCMPDDEESKTIYDLYGRRVAHPQPGSIYIINGKKIAY